MTSHLRITISLALCGLLAACGGSSSGTETASTSGESGGEHHHHGDGEGHHHGEGHHEHAAMPAEVDALHDVLAPVWHSEPGSARATLACDSSASLAERSRAVQASAAPANVEAARWTELTAALTTTADALVTECGSGAAAAETRLSEHHDAFHHLLEAL
jgi:hypothetical protein